MESTWVISHLHPAQLPTDSLCPGAGEGGITGDCFIFLPLNTPQHLMLLLPPDDDDDDATDSEEDDNNDDLYFVCTQVLIRAQTAKL